AIESQIAMSRGLTDRRNRHHMRSDGLVSPSRQRAALECTIREHGDIAFRARPQATWAYRQGRVREESQMEIVLFRARTRADIDAQEYEKTFEQMLELVSEIP